MTSESPGAERGLGFERVTGTVQRVSGKALLAVPLLVGLSTLVGGCSSGGSGSTVAPSTSVLTVEPAERWVLSTIEGQAPSVTARDFVVTNTGDQPVEWMALSTQPWLSLSSSGGQLQPGASSPVSAEVDVVAVTALAPGIYNADLEFHDVATPGSPVAVPVTLTVSAASASISVTPAEGYYPAGPQGGPFFPQAKTFTIENTGNVAADWSVTASAPWIHIADPAAGSLAPGTTTQVEVSVDQAAAGALGVASYTEQVTFHQDPGAVPVAFREVLLDVLPAQSGEGWTEFTPSVDTRIVYVSSSQGNDSNDGLSEASPKRTLSAGKGLMRSGFPDWLLLRKGDTWNEGFGQWQAAGRSPSEPMLVSSYGIGNRPQIRPGSGANGFSIFSGSVHDLAVVDLHFRGDPGNLSGDGFAWLSNNSNGLVEGCLFEYFGVGVDLQGPDNVVVRRNVIAFAGHNAMYVVNVNGLLIEENVIDQIALQSPDIFKQGIYLDNEGNTGMIVRRNVVSNVSSHGLQLRPGGLAENNLFVRTSIALELGGGDSWAANAGGVTAQALNNVILDGKNISPGTPRGWGILMQNVASALVEGNVIANAPLAGNPRPIEVDGWENGNRVHNVTLRDNIVSDWGGNGLRVKGDPGTSIKNLVIDGNDFQNEVDAYFMMEVDNANTLSEITSQQNRFHSAPLALNNWFLLGGVNKSLDGYKSMVGDTSSTGVQVSYPNPAASLASYHASLGKTASHDAFMTEARKQSRDNWRPEYAAATVNDWIRAAFGVQ